MAHLAPDAHPLEGAVALVPVALGETRARLARLGVVHVMATNDLAIAVARPAPVRSSALTEVPRAHRGRALQRVGRVVIAMRPRVTGALPTPIGPPIDSIATTDQSDVLDPRVRAALVRRLVPAAAIRASRRIDAARVARAVAVPRMNVTQAVHVIAVPVSHRAVDARDPVIAPATRRMVADHLDRLGI